ncbi:MAG: hypothetical protein KIS74_04940 [Burkholderiales bacterium]|nr:hypothetical protein [Burkholderiales bacterium]
MSRIYFTDRDLGKRFPARLRLAGLEVEAHHELFPPEGSDEQWLEHCGRRGRIAISHNRRIRHTPNELSAVVRNSVALIIVVGNAPYGDLAENFVRTIARIERFLDRQRAPFICKVYRPSPADLKRDPEAAGSISLWYP